MKANELMIGDWVLDTRTGTPLRVNPFMAELEVPEWNPIPLTTEILEKNGLPIDSYGCCFKEDKCMMLEISVEEDGIYWTINYNEYGILKLEYVHELQHALRLCKVDKEIVVTSLNSDTHDHR